MPDIARRDFIRTTAGAAGFSALMTSALGIRTAALGVKPAAQDNLVPELVRANDELVPDYLERQERRTSHRWLGGIPNEHGIFTASEAARFVSVLACASCAPQSRYFHAAELVGPLHLAVRHLLSLQHDDGTIDLYSTNFHSPPDTAFVIANLGPAYVILQSEPWPPHASLVADLGRFIVNAGEALAIGGIHTPNHRWVVCAALARISALFPDPRYVARIDQWLDETIDIDPDGQYSERSTGGYSSVVDRALITVARLLDRPALYDPVRRNLEMTLFYVHPDGELVTDGSNRQDRYQRRDVARYYYSYRTLALRDDNGKFAAIVRQIEQRHGPRLVNELPAFLEEPALQRPIPESMPLPTNYSRVFRYSGLARSRRQDTSVTILARNPNFFSLRKGSAVLETVRFACAFFGGAGKGQSVGDELEIQDGKYILRQLREGPYYQPIPRNELGAGDNGMETDAAVSLFADRASHIVRDRTDIQRLESVVEIVEMEGVFSLTFNIVGTDNVPVAVELAFRRGGQLRGPEALPNAQDTFLLRSGTGQYLYGDEVIEFGPGRAEHTWTQLRGALPKWDGLSVYLTGFTPFTATINIR